MVADVTETRKVVYSLEFKTWTTKKSSFYCWGRFEFEILYNYL